MNIIYELSPSRFNLVAPLFTKVWADKALTDSVLEGTRPARVFVDYLESPISALIAASSGDYYIMGDPRPGRLRQFLHDVPIEVDLFERDSITLHAPQMAWRTALESDSGGELTFRPVQTFRYSCHTDPLPAARQSTPPQVEVHRINRDVLTAASEGYLTLPENLEPTQLERIYRDGFGYVAIVQDELAGIAYANAVSSWYASIHTEVAHDFRQHGIGTLVTAAFMSECLSNRLTPLMSCQSENHAAAQTALKLGFEEGPAHFVCTKPLPPTEGRWRAEEHPPGIVPDSVLWMRTDDIVLSA